MAENDDLNDDQDEVLFEHHRLVVDKGQALLRIDRFLQQRIAHTSRSRIQEGIAAGFVKVNDRVVKSNYKVHPNDAISISLPVPPRDTEVKPESIPLSIVYEDDHLLVVNKPAGMVVHPAHQNWTGTLANALVWHFQNLPQLPGNEGKPGLVHRIDKDTSGLLVIAKDEHTLAGLARQFFDHTIKRTYWALVWGEPVPAEGTIDANLGRSPKDRRVTMAFPKGDIGRTAITHYRTLQALRYVSLVECQLETGRTHQIRAHMSFIGHPIFNDEMYGGARILKGTIFSKYRQFVENCFQLLPRQALHAKTLGFTHPATGKSVEFDSELPQDFKGALEKWENYLVRE